MSPSLQGNAGLNINKELDFHWDSRDSEPSRGVKLRAQLLSSQHLDLKTSYWLMDFKSEDRAPDFTVRNIDRKGSDDFEKVDKTLEFGFIHSHIKTSSRNVTFIEIFVC